MLEEFKSLIVFLNKWVKLVKISKASITNDNIKILNKLSLHLQKIIWNVCVFIIRALTLAEIIYNGSAFEENFRISKLLNDYSERAA